MTQDQGLNSEIALTFHAVFRKFENALKKAGYSNAAGPDWEAFLHEIRARFDPGATLILYGAVLTLVNRYPERIRRGTVTGATRDLRSLSALVREIAQDLSRNMAHKRYTGDDDEIFYACTVLLDAWSDLEPNVKRILPEKQG